MTGQGCPTLYWSIRSASLFIAACSCCFRSISSYYKHGHRKNMNNKPEVYIHVHVCTRPHPHVHVPHFRPSRWLPLEPMSSWNLMQVVDAQTHAKYLYQRQRGEKEERRVVGWKGHATHSPSSASLITSWFDFWIAFFCGIGTATTCTCTCTCHYTKRIQAYVYNLLHVHVV